MNSCSYNGSKDVADLARQLKTVSKNVCYLLSQGGGGSGTVTSISQSFTGGLISVAGSPITTSGTLALTVAGTSGGIPYFSSASTWASSAALAANALVIGGGAGVAPSTTTTGTGVLTALGINIGSAGAFVTFNGAGGTPSSLIGTNITGTAAGLTAGSVTTNANLTGVITSTGNATSIASQTGTGTKFVVDNSPTLITPVLGVASSTSLSITGTGGGGYFSLSTQSSNPSAPAGGTVLFSNSNSKFSWRGSANNFVKTFDGSSATADRVYSLPDAAGTVVLNDNTATLTNKSIVATQLTGTLQAAQEPAHTGDVTNSAGSLALTIANSAVTQAKTANYSANTFWANNTGSGAAPSDQTFKYASEATYSGTVTFTAGAAPTTPANKYSWMQIGKQVTVWLWLNYTNAGTTVTIASCAFPGDLPTPVEPTGFTATNANLYFGSGGLATATTASVGNNSISAIVKTGTGAYAIVIKSASGSHSQGWATVSYTAQ